VKLTGIQNNQSVLVYERNAEGFVRDYESLKFEDVHAEILDLLPRPGSLVIDIGAGSGRDANGLVARGYLVDAVEPSAEMRRLAGAIHSNSNIRWIDDRLPALSTVLTHGRRYALVLLSAVWMHIESRDRPAAMCTLSRLLDTDGILIITLRLAPPSPPRAIYEVSERELVSLARENDLALLRSTREAIDKLNRAEIRWKTLVFRKTTVRKRSEG
jgi:SAM-dependent methyltransferase